MPIRTASMTKRIAKNGQALHRAMMARGPDEQPSPEEQALAEERRLLKEERDRRQAQAREPKPSAVDRMLRTHHAQPKARPKDDKASAEAKDVKKPKPRRTRAEKHAEKAAALEAARRSPKKTTSS